MQLKLPASVLSQTRAKHSCKQLPILLKYTFIKGPFAFSFIKEHVKKFVLRIAMRCCIFCKRIIVHAVFVMKVLLQILCQGKEWPLITYKVEALQFLLEITSLRVPIFAIQSLAKNIDNKFMFRFLKKMTTALN